MVAIADNFQRQYSHLFPQRRPLLLCLQNENGVKVRTGTPVPKQPVRDICVLTTPVLSSAEVCVDHPPAHGSGAPGTSPLEGLRGLCGRLPVPEASGVTSEPGEDGYVFGPSVLQPALMPPLRVCAVPAPAAVLTLHGAADSKCHVFGGGGAAVQHADWCRLPGLLCQRLRQQGAVRVRPDPAGLSPTGRWQEGTDSAGRESCKDPPPPLAHRVLVVQDVTPEPQQNKYTAKPKKKLRSRYLLQQETRNKGREAAPILEQQVIRASDRRSPHVRLVEVPSCHSCLLWVCVKRLKTNLFIRVQTLCGPQLGGGAGVEE